MVPTLSSVDTSRVLTNSQKFQLGGAWQAAFAVGSGLGLFTELRYRHFYEQNNSEKTTRGEFNLGFGASFDLHGFSPIPFGFLGAYRMTVPAEQSPTLGHDVSSGFFYTGRRNLLLGGEATLNVTPVAPGVSLLVAEAELILRYYW